MTSASRSRTKNWPGGNDLGAGRTPQVNGVALAAGSLDWPHRDPVDRLLAAQAIHEGARLNSVDAAFATPAMVPLLTW